MDMAGPSSEVGEARPVAERDPQQVSSLVEVPRRSEGIRSALRRRVGRRCGPGLPRRFHRWRPDGRPGGLGVPGRAVRRGVAGAVRAGPAAADRAARGPRRAGARHRVWVGRGVERLLDQWTPVVAELVLSRLDLTGIVTATSTSTTWSGRWTSTPSSPVSTSTRSWGGSTSTPRSRGVDLDAAVEGVDIDAIAGRLDIDAVIDRIDVVAMVEEVIAAIDLPAIIRDSTGRWRRSPCGVRGSPGSRPTRRSAEASNVTSSGVAVHPTPRTARERGRAVARPGGGPPVPGQDSRDRHAAGGQLHRRPAGRRGAHRHVPRRRRVPLRGRAARLHLAGAACSGSSSASSGSPSST